MALAVQILFGATLLIFIAATVFGVVMLNKVRKDQEKRP